MVRRAMTRARRERAPPFERVRLSSRVSTPRPIARNDHRHTLLVADAGMRARELEHRALATRARRRRRRRRRRPRLRVRLSHARPRALFQPRLHSGRRRRRRPDASSRGHLARRRHRRRRAPAPRRVARRRRRRGSQTKIRHQRQFLGRVPTQSRRFSREQRVHVVHTPSPVPTRGARRGRARDAGSSAGGSISERVVPERLGVDPARGFGRARARIIAGCVTTVPARHVATRVAARGRVTRFG